MRRRVSLSVIDRRFPVGLSTPRTRGDCIAGTHQSASLEERQTGQRQCAVYGCKHNLLVVDSANRPGKRYDGVCPPAALSTASSSASAPSCALDVADQGEHSSAEVARILGTSTRRVEQIVAKWRKQAGAVRLLGVARE